MSGSGGCCGPSCPHLPCPCANALRYCARLRSVSQCTKAPTRQNVNTIATSAPTVMPAMVGGSMRLGVVVCLLVVVGVEDSALADVDDIIDVVDVVNAIDVEKVLAVTMVSRTGPSPAGASISGGSADIVFMERSSFFDRGIWPMDNPSLRCVRDVNIAVATLR